MQWTAEGATGEVSYWNGDSGWIRQTGIEHEPTSHGQDVMLLSRFLPQEGAHIQLGTKLIFDISADGTARNIKLQGSEPPITEPPPIIEPPILTSISPPVTNTGSQNISARGSNFTSTSVIVFAGVEQNTVFRDSTWLQAMVVSPGVGIYDVLVRDTGGDSASFQFEFK